MLRFSTLLFSFLVLNSPMSFGTDLVSEEKENKNITKQQKKSPDDQKKIGQEDTNLHVVIRQKSTASPNAIPMHEDPQQNGEGGIMVYLRTILGY